MCVCVCVCVCVLKYQVIFNYFPTKFIRSVYKEVKSDP